ncbi:MAG TPA: biotin--[acetyl-CoA-carboxylase] ligase, partial [Lactobacillus sp.]|nr:biotin--[acetyl-CoA-carboxylase] ligase [Lactobacillus sp.]
AGILAEALLEQNAVVLGVGVDIFSTPTAPLPTDQPITTLLAEKPGSDP